MKNKDFVYQRIKFGNQLLLRFIFIYVIFSYFFSIFSNGRRGHPLSTYAKFPEKLILLPPNTHTYVCVSGAWKCYFFGKFWVRTYWMAPNGISLEEIFVIDKYVLLKTNVKIRPTERKF